MSRFVPPAGSALEALMLGQPSATTNPIINFASGGDGQPWDTRFIAGGGATGTPGQGYLNFYGNFFQIIRDPSPIDYTPTRASFVVQHRDDLPITSDYASVPGVVYQFNTTGNANVAVSGGSGISKGFHQGLFANQTKAGDGSAHAFTGAGTIGAVGPGGYNEIGTFVGTAVNIGSTNGLVAFAEGIISDGSSDTAHWDTRMYWGAIRINRRHAGARSVVGLQFTSEGTADIDSLLALIVGNRGGAWKSGLDLSGGIFRTGHGAILPNATDVAWMDSGGTVRPVLGVTSGNTTFLRPAGGGASSVEIHDLNGTPLLRVSDAEGVAAKVRLVTSGATTAQVLTNVTSAPADQAYADMLQTTTGIVFRLLNDAATVATPWLGVTRNGTVAQVVTVAAANIVLQGAVTLGAIQAYASDADAAAANVPLGGVYRMSASGALTARAA